MELKIYDKANNLRLTASPNTSSSVTEEVGGECSVSASFTHTEYIPLDVDDYIELEGVRYKVKSRYRPKQKNTQTYEYSVKFYAPIHDAEDTLMLFQEGGTTSEFSYDGGPREHLQLWIDNMNRRADANLWSIGTVIVADNKTIDYRNVKCWDAAFGSNGIAATFETEMWADGYVINLCKAERGEMVELGYLQGLTNLAQEDNGEVKFFTRLFPLGSTRNINATKYGYSRLQLPDRSLYVDKNVDLYGVKEETEETAFSEIFPKYIGIVSSVRSEEKENEEGRKYTVYYFKDNGMTWNPKDYEIPDLDYMLKFQTGELAGRGTDGSFQAAWHEDTREWEIINVYPDEMTQIPGGAIIPQPGDQYIPWNFAMPQEYITEAEQEYKQAVDDYLNTYSFDPNKYTGTTDRNYIEKNNTTLRIGWNVRLLSEQYFGSTGGYKDTRITKVQRKLNDLCQATITCSDEVGTGWKSSVDNSLDSLRYEVARQAEQYVYDIIKSFETKTPSDNNVFSALKSLKTLLRKDQSDGTNFLLKFGEFIDSMIAGKGAGIFPDGRGQFEKLEVRSAMIVKELIYNRWFSQEGNVTYSEAGTIERFELLSDGTYDLYLRRRWENDITAFKAQDVSYGSVNNLNSTGEYYDSWFRVLSVMQAENKLNVVLYPDEEVPGGKNYEPAVGMVITRRGNAVDEERQGFWYISSYEGCICMLDGVTKPILEESNYSIIIGKLKRLELFDNLPINYRQSYVYCRGIAIQDLMRINYQGVVVVQLNDRGFWSLEVAQSDTPYTAGKETVDTVWHYGCRWKCLVTGTTDEPRYASTGWAMIEGNPAFTIDIESENGWQFDGSQLQEEVVFTTLTVTGQLYNRDVTDSILNTDVTWTRDTGNVSEDNAWAIKRADAGKTLTLTPDDLEAEFGRTKMVCSFKATALLRDGQQTEIAEQTITF
jgi:hypothetical protein